MAEDPNPTPGKITFDEAVSALSAHLGKCSVYRSMGVTVAIWEMGDVNVQRTSEDEVYLHYRLDTDALMRGKPLGLSQEMVATLLKYAGDHGIPVGSPPPPRP